MEFLKKDHNIYRGRLKEPNTKKLIWYDDENTIKSLPTEDDFIVIIKKGDEYLIDILKEKNDLEFLNLDYEKY